MKLYPTAQSFPQIQNFANASEKLLKPRYLTFSMVRYFIWNPNFDSNILSMIVSEDSFLYVTRSRPIQTIF